MSKVAKCSDCSPYDAIRTLAHHILDVVLVGDIERDLTRTAWWRSGLTGHIVKIPVSAEEIAGAVKLKLQQLSAASVRGR